MERTPCLSPAENDARPMRSLHNEIQSRSVHQKYTAAVDWGGPQVRAQHPLTSWPVTWEIKI